MRHDLPNDETCTTPGTTQQGSPEIFIHTDEGSDGTDTDHYMEPDAEANSELLNPTDVNPSAQNMIYVTILNRTVMTTTYIKLKIHLGMLTGTTTCSTRGFWKSATERLRNTYVPIYKTPNIAFGTTSDCYTFNPINFPNCRNLTPCTRKIYPVYPSMPYGALPATFPKIP